MNFTKGQVINLQVICNYNGSPKIICIDKETYKLKINSQPINGKANKEIIEKFKDFGYKVEIVKGQKSQKKIIKIIDLC
ncbi:MAG: DUF167 family protein [Candidatus ainarchaeum sp.]|nr:DUF167 family protein [Candidatus ainarchaeum sp.]